MGEILGGREIDGPSQGRGVGCSGRLLRVASAFSAEKGHKYQSNTDEKE